MALGYDLEPTDDLPLSLDCLNKILKENFNLNVDLKEMTGGSPNKTQIYFQDLKHFLQWHGQSAAWSFFRIKYLLSLERS